MSDLDFTGGIVYDALIVECALKAKADEIAALNTKDFLNLTHDTPIKITAV